MTLPTLAVLTGGISIRMFYYDHLPPHFHVRRAGDQFRVGIADLQLLPGNSGPAAVVNAVRAWATQHQAELALCWARAQSAVPPGRINP